MSRITFYFFLLPLLPSLAAAHDGHGIEATSHYHVTDVWGFVFIAVAAAVIGWFTGRGK